MRELAEIDWEQTRVQNLLAKLEQDKLTAQKTLEQAKAEREQHALVALSGNDVEAQKQLQAARSQCRELEMVVEDTTSAIGAANAQLETLEGERDEAVREEMRREYSKLQLELLTIDAPALERALQSLNYAKEPFVERCRKLDRLALSADIEPTHKNCVKGFRRAVDSRLNVSPVYLGKTWKAFFCQPMTLIFERCLSGGNTEDESEQQRAAN